MKEPTMGMTGGRLVGPILALILTLVSTVGAWADPAIANERHFTFTYETAVLAPGGKEIEVWATPRIGRQEFYSRWDLRTEFEVGLTDRLQASLYLNTKAESRETAEGKTESTFEFDGVSSEWKYKLTDPVADPIGLALYAEVTGSTDELELETKLILDKRVGGWLFAGNLVAANEWGFGPGKTERELEAELNLGVAYFLTRRLSVGLELRNANAIPDGEGWGRSALFLGPTVSYAEESWWVALTVLPQLPSIRGASQGDSRDLDEHEKVNARLLFAFHL